MSRPCPWQRHERVVVAALAAGMTAGEIAHQFKMSVWTVRLRIKTAKKAAGAHTLPGMVATALREGWIE